MDLRVRYGMDLVTEWRSRRWRRLLNMIDHLPRDSFFHEALADDEVLAAQFADRDDEDSTPTRRVSEYSVQVELLSAIVDRVAELTQTLVAVNGAKPRKVSPAPRPVTASQRIRERRAQAKHRSVVSRVLPSGGDVSAFTAMLEQAEPQE